MAPLNSLDDLLTHLGTGPWNMVYFTLVCLCYFLAPMQLYNITFQAPALNYTCLPPEQENVSYITEDSCSYVKWSSGQSGQLVEEEEACTEWEYDTSTYTSTLTSEFGLVCGRAVLRPTYLGVMQLTAVAGGIINGYLADNVGRRLILVVNLVVMSAGSILVGLVSSLTAIMLTRAAVGFMSSALVYMLALEVCQVKHRSTVGILTGLPWALGIMALGGVAFLMRDWRHLQLAISLPWIVIIPFLIVMDESPRWLLVQGRLQEAQRVVLRAAKWNKASLPPEPQLAHLMAALHKQSEAERPRYAAASGGGDRTRCRLHVPKLISTKKIRIIIGMLSVSFFFASFVYMGLSLAGPTLDADPFLYMVLTGVMEVPAYTVTAPIIARWGRKVPTMIGFVVGGIALLGLCFTPQEAEWAVLSLAMMGKMCCSGSLMIMILFQTELVPTEVRMQSKGVTLVSGGAGSILAPYVTDLLGNAMPWLPPLLFSASSLLIPLLLLPLQETLGAPLPDTIGDLERP